MSQDPTVTDPITPDPEDAPVARETPSVPEDERVEPTPAPAPPDLPAHTDTGVTPDPAAELTQSIFDNQTPEERAAALEARVAALEGKVDLIGRQGDILAQAQQNVSLKQQATDVPETGHYQCSRCVEEGVIDPKTDAAPIIEAVHPGRWYAAMGPITCPVHPGQPELMASLERRDQTNKEAADRADALAAAQLSGVAVTPAPDPAARHHLAQTPLCWRNALDSSVGGVSFASDLTCGSGQV